MNKNFQLILPRVLIGSVVLVNLQCAVVFLISPADYASGFELNGIPGIQMVRGLGILFLMWAIPSIFALFDPVRWRLSLIEAILMQAIGLVGESLLLLSLPAGHYALQETATRFIVFDGAGLILLLAALLLSWYFHARLHGAD